MDDDAGLSKAIQTKGPVSLMIRQLEYGRPMSCASSQGIPPRRRTLILAAPHRGDGFGHPAVSGGVASQSRCRTVRVGLRVPVMEPRGISGPKCRAMMRATIRASGTATTAILHALTGLRPGDRRYRYASASRPRVHGAGGRECTREVAARPYITISCGSMANGIGILPDTIVVMDGRLV